LVSIVLQILDVFSFQGDRIKRKERDPILTGLRFPGLDAVAGTSPTPNTVPLGNAAKPIGEQD
jgi:hypothetical protein